MDDLDEIETNTDTIDVQIRIGFTKIFDLDTLNQRFHSEILIESKWYDSNITSLNNEIKWKPDLYIENAINDPKEEITSKILKDSEGRIFVSEIRKVRVLAWENLELESFPLDIQDLSLLIASKKSGNKVNFIINQPEVSKVKISSNLDKSMWYLHEMVQTNKELINREYSFGSRQYPCVRITCQVFREPGYFNWNVIFPILLITFASLCPFVVDHKMPQSRLQATATMLLSSVSYKAAISRLLPTVSYLTSLDKFSLGSIFIITLMLLYHALFAALSGFITINDLVAYKIDKLFFRLSI